MNLRLQTRFDEMSLEITVAVVKPGTVVRVKIFDEKKEKIVFTNRYKTIQKQETFLVRLPLTSETLIISIYDDKVGNIPKVQETNIQVLSVNKKPLEKRLDVVDITNPAVADFIEFAQRFCFNAPYMATGEYYKSDKGTIVVEYLDVIYSQGRPTNTPARISNSTGRIQVAKRYFDQYTVPMRILILCHEFCHYYVSEDITDESEADLNALLIYLGLGYPRIEAQQAFLEVFRDAPSEANKKRYDILNKFIQDFEKDKMLFR